MIEEKIMKFLDCSDCEFAACEQCEINWTMKQDIMNLIKSKNEEIDRLKQYEYMYNTLCD